MVGVYNGISSEIYVPKAYVPVNKKLDPLVGALGWSKGAISDPRPL